MNLLFVCSRNQWRSPTAETIFKKTGQWNVRSAGTEPSARVRINAKTIEWADLIFVMEKRHKERVLSLFPESASQKQIIVLDIPDEYRFMDEELIEIFKASVPPYLETLDKAL